MARLGFSFHSHTKSHLPLAHVSVDEMRSEIDLARGAINAYTRSWPLLISFPFGMWRDFGQAAQTYALSLGYTVVHVEDGWNPPARVRRSGTLRRVALGGQQTDIELYANLEIRPVFKGFLRSLTGA
jgi:peptidoglycan/xylan/chitin deacetylase (PgdA/CDA1 family)